MTAITAAPAITAGAFVKAICLTIAGGGSSARSRAHAAFAGVVVCPRSVRTLELPSGVSVYAAFTSAALVFRFCAFCTFALAALSRNLRDRRTLVGGCFGIDIRCNIGNLCRLRGRGDCGRLTHPAGFLYLTPIFSFSVYFIFPRV